MNACKHGLTSEATILPGEDPQAYDDRLGEWHDHYQPAGPAEQLLVERAVRASWMLDRCTRAEDAVLATRVRHAADDFLRAAREEAEALGTRLIDDDVNYHCHVDSRSQTHADLIEQRRRDDPPILALKLNSFAAGACWMIARWRELDATLDQINHWHYSETFRAIRLLGKRPIDVFDDPIVRLIMFAANAVDPRTPSLVIQVQKIFGQTHNRPDEYNRLEDSGREVPTPEAGLAILRHVIASEIERLETLKQTRLDPLECLDMAAATARAAFDDSDSGALRHRYEASRERALHRALTDLARSIKENPRVEPAPIAEDAASSEEETSSEMASFRQDTPEEDETTPEPPAETSQTPSNPPVQAREEVRSFESVRVGQAIPSTSSKARTTSKP